MTEKLHSILGASSASRWFACPGSPKLCEKAPKQKDSEYAEEGTEAHALAQLILEGKKVPKKTDPAMLEAVTIYTDLVLADQKAMKGKLEVEKRVDLSSIFRGMFGTNDAQVYARWAKLIVYDYKHGAGVPVDVVDNVQLLYYALGAYIELQGLEFTEIEMVIVQPRCDHRDGPIRRWTIPVQYLTAFADQLRQAAEATQKPDAKLVTGKHCRWCPALPICPAAALKVTETAIQDFTEVLPVVKGSEKGEKDLRKPETLSLEQIRTILDNAEYLDAWLRSVEQFAEDQAKGGIAIPGYKLVKKRSNRKWLDVEKTEKELKPKFGKKIYAEPEILSPAQMEKMIGKKEGGEMIVETLSESPDAGVVLVPEDDKRPAVAPPALTDFS